MNDLARDHFWPDVFCVSVVSIRFNKLGFKFWVGCI